MADAKERRRSRSRDRDRKRRSRSRSRSRERRSRRSRSRSRDRDRRAAPRRERKTGFDLGPTGEIAPPVPLSQLPGAFPGLPGVDPASLLGVPGLAFGAAVPAASMTQQATRHARRIYLGGLPPTVEEQPLAALFNQAMHTVRGSCAGCSLRQAASDARCGAAALQIGGVVGPGDSVVNVYINQEKKFAFVEFRSVEECSNAMALDGCARWPCDAWQALAHTCCAAGSCTTACLCVCAGRTTTTRWWPPRWAHRSRRRC